MDVKVKNLWVVENGSFVDWCGHEVHYRLLKISESKESRFQCEVDAHNLGEWRVYGCGISKSETINKAVSEWNEVDKNR